MTFKKLKKCEKAIEDLFTVEMYFYYFIFIR